MILPIAIENWIETAAMLAVVWAMWTAPFCVVFCGYVWLRKL